MTTTHRERRQKRIEKLKDWSDKAETRAKSAFKDADSRAKHMTPGQPILVGHHSEKRHRSDLARIDTSMRKGLEEKNKAKRHEQRAENIESQLEKSIYSDDPDVINALKKRIANLETERARIKEINAWFRKYAKAQSIKTRNMNYSRNQGTTEGQAIGHSAISACHEDLTLTMTETQELTSALDWNGVIGFPSYHLQNLSGNINRNKKRLEHLRENENK